MPNSFLCIVALGLVCVVVPSPTPTPTPSPSWTLSPTPGTTSTPSTSSTPSFTAAPSHTATPSSDPQPPIPTWVPHKGFVDPSSRSYTHSWAEHYCLHLGGRLCTHAAYCPAGTLLPGDLPFRGTDPRYQRPSESGLWAPVADAANQWVQVAATNVTLGFPAQCETASWQPNTTLSTSFYTCCVLPPAIAQVAAGVKPLDPSSAILSGDPTWMRYAGAGAYTHTNAASYCSRNEGMLCSAGELRACVNNTPGRLLDNADLATQVMSLGDTWVPVYPAGWAYTGPATGTSGVSRTCREVRGHDVRPGDEEGDYLCCKRPRCVDAPSWQDAQNRSCAAYQSNGWCNAFRGYGTAWPRAWGTFADHAVDGVDATRACAACGKCAVCVDSPADWRDSQGWGCAAYHQEKLCTATQGYGTGWDWEAYGTFASRAVHGIDATQACCACGRLSEDAANPGPSSEASGISPGQQLFVAGANDNGQLGLRGSAAAADLPLHRLAAPNGRPVVALAAGCAHSAFVAGGQLYTMGANDYGQLGIGSSDPQPIPRPVMAPNGKAVTAVALGCTHSAFIAGGQLYTMGGNRHGQLGQGNLLSYRRPVLVPAPNRKAVTAVALGGFHSAFIAGGTLYVMGQNRQGQLGDGEGLVWDSPNAWRTPAAPSTADHAVPVRVVTHGLVASVAAGDVASAFIADGYLYFLGTRGQAGVPAHSSGTGGASPASHVALHLTPTYRAATVISLGCRHSAYIAAGRLYVLGANDYGQLGLNSSVAYYDAPQAVPVPGSPGAEVTAVWLGCEHSMFAAGGRMYVMGRNDRGQLGLGAASAPHRAPRLLAAGGNAVTAAAPGRGHSLLLAETTDTVTPTSTPTRTPVPTATVTSTATPTPTATRSFELCGPANDGGPLEMGTDGPARRTVWLSPASSGLLHRSALVTLVRLDRGLLNVSVSGCGAPVCNLRFAPDDAGSEWLLPFSIGEGACLSLVWGDTAASASDRRTARGASPVALELAVVTASAPALIFLFCLLGLALVLCLAGLAWWVRTRRNSVRGVSVRRVRRPANWDRQWVPLLFLLEASVLAMGVVWLIGVAATSSPEVRPGLMVGGVVLVVLGAVSLLGAALWAIRDAVTHHCPVCMEAVSQWPFLGTYLPPAEEEGPSEVRKAHSAHVQCLACNRPVTAERWAPGLVHRPYHARCWQTHAQKAWAAEDGPGWCEAQANEAPDVELAHLLAAAIEHEALASMDALLRKRPQLHTLPLAGYGNLTATHHAARNGHRKALEHLLAHHSASGLLGIPEPLYLVDQDGAHSLCLRGLDEEDNDVYLYQPLLTYNAHAVYMGHLHGKYIYYYVPHGKAEGNPLYDEGWCLSPRLGSGAPTFRLLLPPPRAEAKAPQTPLTPSSSSNGHKYTWARVRRLKWFAPSPRRDSWGLKALPVPDVDPVMPNNDAGGVQRLNQPATRVLSAEQLRVQWIPHSTSLLQVAVAAGNEDIIRDLVRVYETWYPSCLRWKFAVGKGLWQEYSPGQQLEISDALAQQMYRVTLNTRNGSVEVNLQRRCETTTKGVSPIRRSVQAAFQCGETVTSDPKAVSDWTRAFVSFSPGHMAAAAPGIDVLRLLCTEGVVDCALWAPPCLTCACKPSCREPMSLKLPAAKQAMLEELLAEEVRQSLKLEHWTSLLVQRDSRPCAGSASTTGISGRLQDGLEVPQGSQKGPPFYSMDYSCEGGTLPFCAALPQNQLGLWFQPGPIFEMITDALMKVREMMRQQTELNPRHIVAVYVYTYELKYDLEGYDQIYASMNRAMRQQPPDPVSIEFWRPLIWELDVALQALPSYAGTLYRGVSCRFDSTSYQAGGTICWLAFSSASKTKAVAERAMQGDEGGTLFSVKTVTAKSIAGLTQSEEDGEVLFRPSTVFDIRSTTCQSGEPVSGGMDTVLLQEVSPVKVAPASIAEPSLLGPLVTVPPSLRPQVQSMMKEMENKMVMSVTVQEVRVDTISARILLGKPRIVPLGPSSNSSVPVRAPAQVFESSNSDDFRSGQHDGAVLGRKSPGRKGKFGPATSSVHSSPSALAVEFQSP